MGFLFSSPAIDPSFTDWSPNSQQEIKVSMKDDSLEKKSAVQIGLGNVQNKDSGVEIVYVYKKRNI